VLTSEELIVAVPVKILPSCLQEPVAEVSSPYGPAHSHLSSRINFGSYSLHLLLDLSLLHRYFSDLPDTRKGVNDHSYIACVKLCSDTTSVYTNYGNNLLYILLAIGVVQQLFVHVHGNKYNINIRV
jgi:hypothetical protein